MVLASERTEHDLAGSDQGKILALDHVNIRTPDVAGLCRFMGETLGMEVRPVPGQPDISLGAWICDAEGRACLHVASTDAAYPGDEDASASIVAPGSGRIHHVAFRCSGYDVVKQRLIENGQAFLSNDFPPMGLRQLFVQDPNSITFELNFFAN